MGLTGIQAALLDAPEESRLRFVPDGALVWEAGRIVFAGPRAEAQARPDLAGVKWARMPHMIILPGLTDAHTHLPQYPGVARGESALLPWLESVVFPLEQAFTGPGCREAARRFFRDMAACGTTAAMVYSSIFEDACEQAFEAAAETGLRVVIGKVMMDIASYGFLPPERIRAVSAAETRRLCAAWHRPEGGRTAYAVTPRFAVSCSPGMLRDAAEIARETGAFVQTHLSENREEIAAALRLHPGARDYTDIYDQAGLLGPRTVLGHCLHLSEREMDALAERRCVAAHCPTANLYLGSGLLPLDRLRRAGVRVALGSDVAAGPELDLWRVMRSALETQKARMLAGLAEEAPPPGYFLHLATVAGAEAVGFAGRTGRLEAGAAADFAALDARRLLTTPPEEAADALRRLDARDAAALVVYRGGPGAVRAVWAAGRRIFPEADGSAVEAADDDGGVVPAEAE